MKLIARPLADSFSRKSFCIPTPPVPAGKADRIYEGTVNSHRRVRRLSGLALQGQPELQAELYLTLGVNEEKLGNLPQADILMNSAIIRR